jgi:hypothetical protein
MEKMERKLLSSKGFWHITALDNLQNILKLGLLSRKKLLETQQSFIDGVPSKLNQKRIRNNLDVFVPFHFYPWNPYDRMVLKEYKDKDFFYIVICEEIAEHLNCKITLEYPNHKDNIQFFEYKKCKTKINEIRRNTNFSIAKDKFEGLGECLIPECVEPKYFDAIILKNEELKLYTHKILTELDNFNISKYSVYVEPGYFYIPDDL